MDIFIFAILTLVAWKRGWKSKALLPVGIGYGALFVVGFIIGLFGSGKTFSALMATAIPYIIAGDLGILIALIVMCVKTPRATSQPAPGLQPPKSE